MPKECSWLAFGCPHVPLHSKDHTKSLVDLVRRVKPEYLVLTGDLFESEAASVWPKGGNHDVLDEFTEAAAVLADVAKASPKATKIWLLGNHCSNYQRNDERRVPKEFRRLCEWNRAEGIGETFRQWRQIEYRKGPSGCFQLGQVVFYHGYDVGTNSDESEALQFNNYTGGASHRLFVRSHTHRPVPITQCMRSSKIELPCYYANVGTLCDVPKMDYASRSDTSKWKPGPIHGKCTLGRACYNEVRWTATQELL
jgi:predicted MPP superfamily phosphohydrolase